MSEEHTERCNFQVTPAEKAKVKRLGGVKWFRRQIAEVPDAPAVADDISLEQWHEIALKRLRDAKDKKRLDKIRAVGPELLDALEALMGWETHAPESVLEQARSVMREARGDVI